MENVIGGFLQFGDLQVAVIDEATVVLRHAAAHAVVRERDCRRGIDPVRERTVRADDKRT